MRITSTGWAVGTRQGDAYLSRLLLTVMTALTCIATFIPEASASEPKRGWLGVNLLSVKRETAAAIGQADVTGAFVLGPLFRSPAWAMDIRSGDTILALGDEVVRTSEDVARIVTENQPGAEIAIRLFRNGAIRTEYVLLGEQPVVTAEQRSAAMSFDQAMRHRYRDGPESEAAAARPHFEAAAKLGHAQAMANLGWLYMMGRGGERSTIQAAYWYGKAAEAGHTGGMNALGVLLNDGQGVEKNVVAAHHLFLRAAELGSPTAMYNVASNFAYGEVGPADHVAAREWYEKAALAGEKDALYDLGALYAAGKGVQQDFTRARIIFEYAASLGVARAMNDLGVLHYKGNGGPRDFEKARVWFARARDGGYAKAADNLEILDEEQARSRAKR